jgi:hypothetical protein
LASILLLVGFSIGLHFGQHFDYLLHLHIIMALELRDALLNPIIRTIRPILTPLVKYLLS